MFYSRGHSDRPLRIDIIILNKWKKKVSSLRVSQTNVEYSNIKPFIIGMVICSFGTFLAVEMLGSTSWTTYSSTDIVVIEEEFTYTMDYTTEMEIGLREAKLVQKGELYDEDNECFDLDVDWELPILENPNLENGSIDCINTQDEYEIELCETESAGSTGHSIILGGLGLLALTFVLACIGVMGYIPGWVLKLLSSLAAITIFVGPIVWFVMLPDLNSGLEPNDEKWGLSHAFYLTLLSAPVVFVGGLVCGKMEAFAFEEDDDWDDDEHDYYQTDDDYSALTTSIAQPDYTEPEQPDLVDVNWQGEWADDGYEWIEHPEGSEIWYWRDQDTGQWVRH